METAGEELNQVQLAELKKVFSIFDREGTGFIIKSELRDVITAITDEVPTEDELAKLMLLVDKDGNGKIEWVEFLSAMTSWLGEEFKSHRSNKRKEHPDSERQEVHKKIKSFFQQFKQDSEFARIRRQIENEDSTFLAHAGQVDHSADIVDAEGYISDRLSSEAKLKFLMEYRATINNLPNVIQALLVDPFKQAEAMACIAKLLSIVEVFKTPMERRAVADDIVRIYEAIVRANLISTFVQLADKASDPRIQWEAVRAISYLAPGPRIASTPENSLLHPGHMYFKRLLVSENAVPVLLNLVSVSAVKEVKEQAVVALGTIASHNPEARDYLLKLNVLSILLTQLTPNTPITMLRKLSWTLSILCGVTHSMRQLPSWDYLKHGIQSIASLMFVNDEEVLVNLCPALSLLLPGVPEMLACRRLVELLKIDDHPRIQKAAVKAITNIIRYDNVQTNMFINHCSLLSYYPLLLRSSDTSVRLECLESVLVLAGLKGELQALIVSGICGHMVSLLNTDDALRPKIAKILKYVSRGSPSQVQFLVQNGLVSILCKSLGYFKTYDKVLTKVYKYIGPTYNFELARDVLVALDNIINVGEMETESNKKSLNQYALSFDLECIDKLKSLVAAIVENPHKEEINAWRLERPGDSSLEEKVKDVLLKIRTVYKLSNDPSSATVVKMIEDTVIKYFQNQQTTSTLLIKAVLGEDIRVVGVPRNIAYHELKKGLEFKFSQSDLKLAYEDEEKDLITIDSQNSLDKAIQRYANAKTVKIHLLAPKSKSDVEVPKDTIFSSPAPRKRPQMSRDNSLEITPSKTAKSLFSADKSDTKNISFNLEDVKRLETRKVFESLAINTHFGTKELEDLYSKWSSQSKTGEVSRDEFTSGLKGLGITDPLVIEQYISAFDTDRDGKINFREFVTGLSVVQRGTIDERLKFMFKAYDTNGDGVLSPNEVYNLLKATHTSSGETVSHEELLKRVQKCFKEVDVNNDGTISFEEFVQAVKSSKLVIDNFVNLPY